MNIENLYILLRAGLWNKASAISSKLSENDWAEILQIAEEQNISDVIANSRNSQLTESTQSNFSAEFQNQHDGDNELLVISEYKQLLENFLRNRFKLKQICDWCLCLHNIGGKIDTAKLKYDLKHQALLHSWMMFGCIAVHVIGLPEEEFPLYDKRYIDKADNVFYLINESVIGNRSDSIRPTGHLKMDKAATMIYRIRIAWAKFSIFPVESWKYRF